MPRIKIEEERVQGERSFSHSILLLKEPFRGLNSLGPNEYDTHYGVITLTLSETDKGLREAHLTWVEKEEALSKLLESSDHSWTVELNRQGIGSETFTKGPVPKIVTLFAEDLI